MLMYKQLLRQVIHTILIFGLILMIIIHLSHLNQFIKENLQPQSTHRTQREEQHGNAFPSVSISVHQWLNIVFLFFAVLVPFVVHPLQTLMARHASFDSDHPASDVNKKSSLHRPTGLRPSASLGAHTPQLRFGNILSMVNLLFGASQTSVARRAYSEQGERC